MSTVISEGIMLIFSGVRMIVAFAVCRMVESR